MRQSMIDRGAEDATGCRARSHNGPLYADGGTAMTDSEARVAFWRGEPVEDPNAGAGSYRRLAERMGFAEAEAIETSSSAGDWLIAFRSENGRWHAVSQDNRYPRHGFRYVLHTGGDYESIEELCSHLMEA